MEVDKPSYASDEMDAFRPLRRGVFQAIPTDSWRPHKRVRIKHDNVLELRSTPALSMDIILILRDYLKRHELHTVCHINRLCESFPCYFRAFCKLRLLFGVGRSHGQRGWVELRAATSKNGFLIAGPIGSALCLPGIEHYSASLSWSVAPR